MKRKAVHTLVLLHIFIHFLVACKNRIRSQLRSVFFKSTPLSLVNLQAVAGGKIRRTLIMHDNDNDKNKITT